MGYFSIRNQIARTQSRNTSLFFLIFLMLILLALLAQASAVDNDKLINISVTEFTSDERSATVELSFMMGTSDKNRTREGVERAMKEVIRETSSEKLVDKLAEIWSEEMDISLIKTFRVIFEVFRG